MQLGIYRHYKGMEYRVLCLAKLEETLEDMVVYQALYDEYTIWIRPLRAFQETVDVPEFSHTGPRFQFVRPWTPEDGTAHPQALTQLEA